MDLSACNYSVDAQIDDGSCEYPAANYDCSGNCIAGAAVVTAGGGSFESEVFWSLTNCAGDIILEGGAPFAGCADVSGGYSVLLGDTYGDGWNGNTLSVGDASYTIESGAEECKSLNYFHEIQCQVSEIYNVKKELEKKISNFISTEIEWRPINSVKISNERNEAPSPKYCSCKIPLLPHFEHLDFEGLTPSFYVVVYGDFDEQH